ncbi:LysR family transcriptional regulator [Prauserella cavernicola]|uniref:LysR family transcriptional regulator n=1 Tax=Prauserella cavernicola TaxID=2800127 RepID=A0A934V7L5_9PSEU|nr:LysR family transcriptional regulator [Prauserella cavernicola]MBK1787824.1 LysR family transcriptional regulator [Prauserella cavernicola]
MDIDLRRLFVLEAVVRHGTMLGAAEELSYTQSAVSQQIRRLEAELKTKVLERHPRGVFLTEAGRLVVARARAVQRELQRLRNDLDDLAGARTGTVRLGVFPTFAASLLPLVIRRFREQHPDVELVLRNSRGAPLRELLEAREIDMALAWDYPWNRVDDPGMATRPLLSDRSVLVLPRTHRYAGHRRVSLADLADETWVVRAGGHPTSDLLARCAGAAGFTPRIAVEANDYPEVQAMIAGGLGITLCPGLATQPLREDVIVTEVEATVPARQIYTAHLAGREPSPAYRAMESVMADVVRESV